MRNQRWGERFHQFAEFEYLGASRYAIRSQPFGSWLASGTDLHVFYALDHNGEQPAGCSVLEFDDKVVVSITIRDWPRPQDPDRGPHPIVLHGHAEPAARMIER